MERVFDSLLDDSEFQSLIKKALKGQITAQELGYEIMTIAESIQDHMEEQAQENAAQDMGDMMRKEYEEHA